MKNRPVSRTPAGSTTQPGSTPELLEQIRVRAYGLFEQRGRTEGHELEDWLRAEAEVLQQKAKTTAA
ncbi:MAG TPA: DUF2934 domain-containing protein [Terriglobales bacterium]|nr:DUF2934 domain-containing protein [Terriglobales bacterium]